MFTTTKMIFRFDSAAPLKIYLWKNHKIIFFTSIFNLITISKQLFHQDTFQRLLMYFEITRLIIVNPSQNALMFIESILHWYWRRYIDWPFQATFRTATFFKKRHKYSCYSVNNAKFLRTPILKNICERLLLKL